MEPALDIFCLEPCPVKNRRIRCKINGSTRLFCLSDHGKKPVDQIHDGIAILISVLMDQPVTPDGDRELRRERVDDRGAHAMQAAAGLVCIVIKFASRMECGEDDPLRADTLLVHSDRYPPAVVGYRGRTVLLKRDADLAAHACKVFVHRVVDDLIDEMIQSLCGHTSYVHARPLPDSFQPLQDSDAGGVVYIVIRFCHRTTMPFCIYFYLHLSSNQKYDF